MPSTETPLDRYRKLPCSKCGFNLIPPPESFPELPPAKLMTLLALFKNLRLWFDRYFSMLDFELLVHEQKVRPQKSYGVIPKYAQFRKDCESVFHDLPMVKDVLPWAGKQRRYRKDDLPTLEECRRISKELSEHRKFGIFKKGK